MGLLNGVHHLAISTANMHAQIEYFTDVLGMELVALYPMHGVDGATHAFVKASDSCYIAFVAMASIADVPVEIGKTHAGWGGAPSSPGTMQHLALNVASEVDLLAMRDRIRKKGLHVFGPVDHGFCKSIYFAGPEHLTLEVAHSAKAIDERAWIDPESARLVGISPEDLARYRTPIEIVPAAAPVAQPATDPTKPLMTIPEEQYRQMLELSDADYDAQFEKRPPVKVDVN